jgi:hypothetical protein
LVSDTLTLRIGGLTVPKEATQLDMFQEDLMNSILGQILYLTEQDEENDEDAVDETETEEE